MNANQKWGCLGCGFNFISPCGFHHIDIGYHYERIFEGKLKLFRKSYYRAIDMTITSEKAMQHVRGIFAFGADSKAVG